MTLQRAAARFDALKSLALLLTAASHRTFLCPKQFCAACLSPRSHAGEIRQALYAHCALLMVICHHWRYPLLPLLMLAPDSPCWGCWRRALPARLMASARLLGYGAPLHDSRAAAGFVRAQHQHCFLWARGFCPCNDNSPCDARGNAVSPAICDRRPRPECARPGFRPGAICCPPPRRQPENRFWLKPGLSPAPPEIRRASWLPHASDV